MKYVFDDGGRAAAGFRGSAGDCVARAVAIASGRPYAEVYAALARGAGAERRSKGASARNGIRTSRKWFGDYMRSLGFEWFPTMRIGSGCVVHLVDGELPPGRLVVRVSRHCVAVIDGVLHDTHNPSERGTTVYSPNYPRDQLPKGARLLSNGNGWAYSPSRCVYGYWKLSEGSASK